MEEALKLIIARSPNAAREAITCMRALAAKSPVVMQRYMHAMELALNDPTAIFSPKERVLLAEPLEVSEDENRSKTLRIRLTDSEWETLNEWAAKANMDKSKYVRSVVFG